ncbi:MAG TPA: hypothetical protein VGE76_04860, partial [Opitutaceae bacterium]
MLQGDLVQLAKQRDSLAKGSTERLRVEREIVERSAAFRQQRGRVQMERVAQIPLPQVEEAATGFAATFRKVFSRKFSFGDVLKDSLRGFGVAGAGAIVSSVADLFQRRAERASAVAGTTGAGLDNLRATLATIGGLNRELSLGQREFRDLNTDIAMTKAAIADLTEGGSAAIEFINPFWRQQVDVLNGQLDELQRKQNAIGQRNTLLTREVQYQADLYKLETAEIAKQAQLASEGASEEKKAAAVLASMRDRLAAASANKRPPEEQRAITLEIKRQEAALAAVTREARYRNDVFKDNLWTIKTENALQARGATELERARAGLLAIRAQLATARINNRPAEEERAITLEYERQRGVVDALTKALKARKGEVEQALTQDAAQGRTFRNGQRRPRSETERLAEGALRQRQQARDATLTGQAQLVRDSLGGARSIEGSVASRLGTASRLVPTDRNAADLSSLRTELVNANQLLTSINSAL